jgi:hypothetical protein
MKILNAIRMDLSIVDDSGELINIPPGQLSKSFIGSAKIVLSAIELGYVHEIGIILESQDDFDEAVKVPLAIPYLYSNENEAISKLIDKNIDYTKN